MARAATTTGMIERVEPKRVLGALVVVAFSSVAACASRDICVERPLCDIRSTECQALVWAGVQCDRGRVEGPPPVVRVIDPASYRAELEAEAALYVPTALDLHIDATLRLLWLIGPESSRTEASIESSVARVGAYYSAETMRVTVIDRGTPMALETDLMVLAHEFTHALQDRRYGIRAFFEAADLVDARLARVAVVEGDATFEGLRYRELARGRDVDTLDWRAYFARWSGDVLTEIAGSADSWPLAGSLLYPLGGNVAASIALDEGSAGLDALFAAPPSSSREVAADWLLGERASPAAAVECTPPPPADGMTVVWDNAWGVPYVYAVVASTRTSVASQWDAARASTGDRAVIYGDGTGARTAVVWRIRFDSLAAARAFYELALYFDGELALDGTDVLLAATDDPSATTWLDAAVAPCLGP